ncbi:hypothetical protein FZEAL_9854 [Fusarium zealandicum]|uniref:DUF7580 domain-containing protein n=1 Tax=Fusarium zealandicum TaxID=1053134 RepID=A0A8H4XDR6_9HYPO|nr:hypothetical protein FZEAL_9854 [Fusarium zealandicum]
MSGFEIAGVVLGSIPLLVSTLENYKNGSLIRNLDTERVKLQNVCEKLLDGLVPPSRIDTMVENPHGALWTEKETQKKIRARLWRSWDVFERTLKDIQSAIGEIYEKLGGEPNTNASDKSFAVKELKRFSFTLSRSTYADQLSVIKDGVSNLESLAAMNIELEPQRRVRSRIRLLNILRDLSSSIYRAIRSSLTCPCQHRLSMRLSRCVDSITPIDDDEDVIQNTKVHLALSFDRQCNGSLESPMDKHEWEEICVQASPSIQTQPETLTLPGSQAEITANLGKSRKKAVKFYSSRLSSFSSTTTTTQTETSTVTEIMAKMSLEATGLAHSDFESRINPCSELKKSQRPSCLGVISDQPHATTTLYTIYPATSFSSEASNLKMVSLGQVLEPGNNQSPMTYRQRLQLAVSISTSVLQLYDTPWLPKTLSNQNIFFIKNGTLSYYETAFVMAERSDLNDYSKAFPIIRNPTLLALGVILIELLRGRTIDSLRAPDEILGTDLRPLSDYMTARRLLGEVCQVSSNYGSAVRRCIDGEFQRQDLDLENEDFRHEVYCGVVALLEEDLSNL